MRVAIFIQSIDLRLILPLVGIHVLCLDVAYMLRSSGNIYYCHIASKAIACLTQPFKQAAKLFEVFLVVDFHCLRFCFFLDN